jgi:uncharacterized protein (DUF488 family)
VNAAATSDAGSAAPSLWTVGHSNRQLGEFIELLRAERVQQLVDVRRFPGSRRHPQFGGETLAAALGDAGIDYRHLPELGGRRSARRADSPNTAWRVEAFNAYADHLQSAEAQAALEELAALAAAAPTAIMCAEALPWQCHRRLIADIFVARGWRVTDIVGPRQTRPHALPEFARAADGRVTYPGGALF